MKEKIIKEIQRVATLLGKSPGLRTFAHETGITENDWEGIYWARWGDALEDAGFQANMLQQPHDEDFLLKKYCEATLHFRKAPTRSELRMYSHQHPNFPSYTTMQKRFGSIAEVRAQARIWAEDRQDFGEILHIIPEEARPSETPQTTSQTDGWVYLLQSGKHYKIGRGEDLERRVKQVSIAMPEKVELIHSIKTDDPSGIEAYWHNRFKEKRKNGEWFELSPADLRAFKRRKFQ